MQTGWPCTHMWWLRVKKDISMAEIPPEQQRVQFWEMEPAQVVAVKVSGNFIHLGEKRGCWKTKHPLKGPVHQFTCSQALTLGSSRGTATWGAPEREKNCEDSGRELEGQSSLSL